MDTLQGERAEALLYRKESAQYEADADSAVMYLLSGKTEIKEEILRMGFILGK